MQGMPPPLDIPRATALISPSNQHVLVEAGLHDMYTCVTQVVLNTGGKCMVITLLALASRCLVLMYKVAICHLGT
jgi:hypothetical protein